jgi:hypothetical protein
MWTAPGTFTGNESSVPAMSLQPRSVGTQMMFSAAGKSIRMNSEKALKI